MSFSGVKYRRTRCENINEMIRTATFSPQSIQLLTAHPPTFSFIRLDQHNFMFKLILKDRVMSQKFRLGEEFEMEKHNGTKLETTAMTFYFALASWFKLPSEMDENPPVAKHSLKKHFIIVRYWSETLKVYSLGNIHACTGWLIVLKLWIKHAIVFKESSFLARIILISGSWYYKVKVIYTLEGDDVLNQVIKHPDGRVTLFRREFGTSNKMIVTASGMSRPAIIYYEIID